MNYRLTAFFLVPLAGLFLLFHTISYQFMLAQGDHGRDLYAFAQTLQGQVPYQDYWWVYGPLMPYYYALFFKIFGIGVVSALVGKLILNVLAGLFMFYALSVFIPPLIAFIAAMWFWMFQPDFFFTYNHIGGLTCLMAIIFALFCYIRQPKVKYLYAALFLSFLLSMIKVNFGIASLFVIILFYQIYDRMNYVAITKDKKTFRRVAVFVVPAMILLIYIILLHKLSIAEIRQCLPYLSSDQPYHSTPWQSLQSLGRAILYNITQSPANIVFSLVVFGAIVISLIKIIYGKMDLLFKKQILTAFALLVVFYIANLHEYLFSGVLYRSFWATPFSTMMLFLILGFAVAEITINLQRMLFGVLFVIIFMQYSNQLENMRSLQLPEQYLAVDRGHVLTHNPPAWFNTVQQTSEFLKRNLPANETFLALPYDPLYYYLTARTSPSRQLIFFEHINIPAQQEKQIIVEMELNHVNYVLISNRAIATLEPGLGVFGKTYCPTLAKYIAQHYQPIAQFGDWKNEPGWAWNHGTQILKRVK